MLRRTYALKIRLITSIMSRSLPQGRRLSTRLDLVATPSCSPLVAATPPAPPHTRHCSPPSWPAQRSPLPVEREKGGGGERACSLSMTL